MTRYLGKPTTILLMVGLAATTSSVHAATACATNDDCSVEEFCWLPDGECSPQDLIGLCWVIPSACPADYDPVCGCDYQTYSNDCMAHMAGVSMVHYGDCEPCESNPCGVGEFCQLPIGECSSGLGTCLVPPGSCETTCPQVCGCNDVAYANECQALVDGVSLSHRGPCNNRFDLIVADIGFSQQGELYWSHETGATSYNIYRAVATHGTSMDAAVCFLPDVPGPYLPIPALRIRRRPGICSSTATSPTAKARWRHQRIARCEIQPKAAISDLKHPTGHHLNGPRTRSLRCASSE